MGFILVLSLFAAAQVAPAPGAVSPAPQPSPPTPPSQTRAFVATGNPGVVERTWRLERMNGAAVTSEVTLRLARGGPATGTSGCNRFFAEYAMNGASLRIVPPLTRPLLACAPEVMRLEGEVRASLLRVQSWTITPAGDLSLDLEGGGNMVFHAI